MATFLSDTFTAADGTLLTAHAPDSPGGASWIEHPTATPDLTITSNRVRAGGTGINLAYSSVVPTSADYYVEAVVRCVSNTQLTGFFLRLDTTAMNGYQVLWGSTGNITVDRVDAGVSTNLGTAAEAGTAGEEHTLRGYAIGDQISLHKDGALILGPYTDATYASAGRVGIRSTGGTATTGYHLDSLAAATIDVAAAADLTLLGVG